MRLKPDLELLERIGIPGYDYYKEFGEFKLEIEESDFESLSPFLIRWGAGEVLQELFFYQLNFVPVFQPPKPQTLRSIQEDRKYFQSREKLAKMDFEQLKGIKLIFGKINNGIKADLPPDLVEYIKKCLKAELFSEVNLDHEINTWEDFQTTYEQAFDRYKNNVNQLENSKLKIQNALPSVEAILKAKNPEAIFTEKQIILCAYGIFYQRGHRLNFKDHTGTEPETPENVFNKTLVYDNLRRE